MKFRKLLTAWLSEKPAKILNLFTFFLISNKDSLISKRERHPSTQGVYRGEQIKNEHYKNQENPK